MRKERKHAQLCREGKPHFCGDLKIVETIIMFKRRGIIAINNPLLLADMYTRSSLGGFSHTKVTHLPQKRKYIDNSHANAEAP